MYFQRKCKFCGKVFNTKRYPNQFCSQSCYFKSKRAERNAAKVKAIKESDPDLRPVIVDGYVRYKHQCKYCKREFMSVRSSASFCSKQCYRRQMKGLKDESDKIAKVAETLERAEYYNEKFRGKALKFTKVCPVCGQEFVASKVTTMFCSNACARRFRQHQSAEERQKRMTAQKVELQLTKAKSVASDTMRPEEVARYLGVARATVYRYIEKGIIPAVMLPGATLIARDCLDELFRQGKVFREPRKAPVRIMPEVQHSPVVEQSGEYISIAEAAQAYGLPLNVTQNYLRRSNLEFVRFRNIRFYLRSDVDRLLRSREKARHPEITEWYTVEDIMANYAMDRKSVYNFVSTHEFPRRKDGLKAKYSKSHVDELLSRTSGILDDYYTADQIEEKYAFDKRRLYKLVNRIGIPKRNISGKLYIEKEAFDKFMSLNVN